MHMRVYVDATLWQDLIAVHSLFIFFNLVLKNAFAPLSTVSICRWTDFFVRPFVTKTSSAFIVKQMHFSKVTFLKNIFMLIRLVSQLIAVHINRQFSALLN